MPQPSHVVFVDTHCTGPYDSRSPLVGGLDGAEASILRLASGLARDRRRSVRVTQRGRVDAMRSFGVTFEQYDAAAIARDGQVGAVIVRSSWAVACALREAGVRAPILVWQLEDPSARHARLAAGLAAADVRLVACNDDQARRLAAFVAIHGLPIPAIGVLPHPVPDDLAPDGTLRDPDLLLFASSPLKGLPEAIALFARIRRRLPSMRLAVADPGYLGLGGDPHLPGVIWLGHLPEPRLHDWMRRALCLFQPQATVAECFGRTFADANALGTPVLLDARSGDASGRGGRGSRLVDGRDAGAVIDRIEDWRQAPPRVDPDPRNRLEAVAAEWTTLVSRTEGGGGEHHASAADGGADR